MNECVALKKSLAHYQISLFLLREKLLVLSLWNLRSTFCLNKLESRGLCR